jgi:hypothetical protein
MVKHSTSIMRKVGNYKIVQDGKVFVVLRRSHKVFWSVDFVKANRYFELYLSLAKGE